MPKTRLQKENTVTKLTDEFGRAKSVVFADYKGLKMTQLSILRDKLRDQGATLSVTKNSLVSLALKQSDYSLPTTAEDGRPKTDSILEGPTATLLAFEDEITPLKSLVQGLKEAGSGKVKGGFVNGDYYDSFSIIRLSNLPTKLELQAKVVGSLSSPLYGIVGVLQANIRNLVYVVSAIQKQKGGE